MDAERASLTSGLHRISDHPTLPWVILALLLILPQAHWPQFRGPTGDGKAAADASPPVEWSETRNVAWKTAVPGRGRSSPVILGDRIFVTRAIERNVVRKRIGPDDQQVADHVELGAACLDRRTGEILWDVALKSIDAPEPVHVFNSWATPTPAAEGNLLWCDFGGMGTWCLDGTGGRVVWQRTIPLDAQVGPGSSLLLHGKHLVMVRDGRDEQYVTALDKATGETVWKTARPPIETSSPNHRKSFSTPVAIGDRIVASGAHWIAAYEPAGGRELWRIRHGNGFSIGSVPVSDGSGIYFSTGCMKPSLLAVRADGAGDVVWRSEKGVPVMSSPLLAEGRITTVSDEGVATCVMAAGGATLWQERLGEAHLASPLLAAGRIYFFGREGTTTVLKSSGAVERLAQNKLDGTVIATPAIVGTALFVRTDTHLYRIEGR